MAWWPSNHAMRRLASEGKIGKVWRLHGVVGHGGPSPGNSVRRVFFDWLTDPDANGAGALVDFGIYNATWAVWHLGMPERVYSTTHQLQPEKFPKVDDNAVLVLSYPNQVGVFEASWNLPRGFQQLEIFGDKGSLSLNRTELNYRDGRKESVPVDLGTLDAAASNPIRYMIDRVTRDERARTHSGSRHQCRRGPDSRGCQALGEGQPGSAASAATALKRGQFFAARLSLRDQVGPGLVVGPIRPEPSRPPPAPGRCLAGRAIPPRSRGAPRQRCSVPRNRCRAGRVRPRPPCAASMVQPECLAPCEPRW